MFRMSTSPPASQNLTGERCREREREREREGEEEREREREGGRESKLTV